MKIKKNSAVAGQSLRDRNSNAKIAKSALKASVGPKVSKVQADAEEFLTSPKIQETRQAFDKTKDLFIFTRISPSKRVKSSFFSDGLPILQDRFARSIFDQGSDHKNILAAFKARSISFFYAHHASEEAKFLFKLKDIQGLSAESAIRSQMLFSSAKFYDEGDYLPTKGGLYYNFSRGIGVRKSQSTADYLLSHLSKDEREMALTFSLSAAAKIGDIAAARSFIKAGANPDHPLFGENIYPLTVAVRAKNLEFVKFLLKLKADPLHKVNDLDSTPLMLSDPHGPIHFALERAIQQVGTFDDSSTKNDYYHYLRRFSA